MRLLPSISTRRLSQIALWGSVVSNLLAVGGHLWAGALGSAALQSTVVVLLLAWVPIRDRLDAQLAALTEKAQIDRDLSKQAFEVFTRGLASGHVSVEMGGRGSAKPWAN
jgi:hypothetical protein